jgi:hypothetical protein
MHQPKSHRHRSGQKYDDGSKEPAKEKYTFPQVSLTRTRWMESRKYVQGYGEHESKAPDNQSSKNAPFVECRFVRMLQFRVGDQHATSIPCGVLPRNGVTCNFNLFGQPDTEIAA